MGSMGMLALVVVLLLCLRCTPSPSSASVTAPHTGLKWKVPAHMLLREDEMQTFEAVSSHGRDDLDLSSSSLQGPSTLRILWRSLYLLLLFLPVVLTALLAYLSQVFCRGVWFALLTHSMAGGGAAFIKWGQWASTRPDLFPEDLCVALSHLHSNAPKHSFAFTRNQIRKEFGDSIEDIFDQFSSQPVASGSIAQVYKAVLNGQRVAVKVRHPGVEEQIQIDFVIMKAIAAFLEGLPGMSWLNLSESLTQFSHTIAAQTDLSVEGKHLFLFNKHFKRWMTVDFPRPLVLSESVLVESWEEGTTVSEYTDLYNSVKVSSRSFKEYISRLFSSPDPVEKERISPELAFFVVSKGVEVYLKMLLADNLMHADLHPGNIFLRQYDPHGRLVSPEEHRSIKDSRGLRNQIVLLDAGMVARLIDQEQENFIGLLQSMGRGRGDEAAHYILRFSSRKDYDDTQKAEFIRDMVALFKTSCRGYHYNVNIGQVLQGILQLVRVHRITIEANYATLVMNALCLDSLAGNLIPSYNILDGAKHLLVFHRSLRRFLGLRFFRRLVPLATTIKSIEDSFFYWRVKRLSSDYRNR